MIDLNNRLLLQYDGDNPSHEIKSQISPKTPASTTTSSGDGHGEHRQAIELSNCCDHKLSTRHAKRKKRRKLRRRRQALNKTSLVTSNIGTHRQQSRNDAHSDAAQDPQQLVSTSLPLQTPFLRAPVHLLLAAAAAGQYPLPLLSPLAQTLNDTANYGGQFVSAGNAFQNHFTSLSADARACVTATYLCVLIVNNTWLDCNLLETLCRNGSGAPPATGAAYPLALKPLNKSSLAAGHAEGRFGRQHDWPRGADDLSTAMLALQSTQAVRDEEDEGGGRVRHASSAMMSESAAMGSGRLQVAGEAEQDELSVDIPIRLELPWQPGERMDMAASADADQQQQQSFSSSPDANGVSAVQVLNDKLSLYSQIVSLIANENLASANRMQQGDKAGRLVDEADSNSILEQYFKFRKYRHNYPKTKHRERDVATSTTTTDTDANAGQTFGENLGNIYVDNAPQSSNPDSNKSLSTPVQPAAGGSGSLTQWMIRSFKGLGSYSFWPIYGSTATTTTTAADSNQSYRQPTSSRLVDGNGDSDGYAPSAVMRAEQGPMQHQSSSQQQHFLAQFLRPVAGERNGGYQQFGSNDIASYNQSQPEGHPGRQQEFAIDGQQANPLGRGDDSLDSDPADDSAGQGEANNGYDGPAAVLAELADDKRRNSRGQAAKPGFSLFTISSHNGRESIVPVEMDPRQLVEQSAAGGEPYDAAQGRRHLDRFAQEQSAAAAAAMANGNDRQQQQQCLCTDRLMAMDPSSDQCRLRCGGLPARMVPDMATPATTMLMTAATDASPSSSSASSALSVLVPTSASPALTPPIGTSAKLSPLDVTYLLYTRYHRDLVQEIATAAATAAASAAVTASASTSQPIGAAVSPSAASTSALTTPALAMAATKVSSSGQSGASQLASQLVSENLIRLGDVIDLNNETTLNVSHFNSSLPVKIIIHGFGSGGRRPWVTDMVYKLLEYENVNVIVVDWEKGATLPNYVQAAGNTRLVGHKIATLIKKINLKYGLTGDSYHLIGFSLGAHVAGFAGMEIRNSTPVVGASWIINRITGLDPASPLFEGYEANDRLDPSDAQFVDVIHSNGDGVLRGGFGSLQPMGHVDFYPNGGRVQVGCNSLLVSALSDIIYGRWQSLCNHRRALNFFMDSFEFNQCRFRSFNCDSYENYLKGDCFDCGRDNEKCSYMGYLANYSKGRGKMYLTTHEDAPFCANQFMIKIIGTKGYRSHWGKVEVTLLTIDGKNETFLLSSMSSQPISQSFEGAISGSKEILQHSMQSLIVAHPNLSNFTRVLLRYNRYKGWIYNGDENWPIDKVYITDSEGQVKSYCGFNTVLESHITTRLDLEPGNCTVLEPTGVGSGILAGSAAIQSMTTPTRTLASNGVGLGMTGSSQVPSTSSTPTPLKIANNQQTVTLQVSSNQRQQPAILVSHHFQQQPQQQQQQQEPLQVHNQQVNQSARTPRLLAALAFQTTPNDVITSSTLSSSYLR